MDWSTLPPYVIGRRAYDNALVDWAFHNAVLVDATDTIKAVHQTLADGNSAGHSSVHTDNEYNANLPGGAWDHGSTSAALYRTVVFDAGLAVVDKTKEQVWPPLRTAYKKKAALYRTVAFDAALAVVDKTKEQVLGQKKVVSYSLYGNHERYVDGAIANAGLMSTVYPGWIMRVYHDKTVMESVLLQLRDKSVELILVDNQKIPAEMTWRFFPIQDTDVSIFISRDIDSRLSKRERTAVAEWESSMKPFHIMRDHPSHSLFKISGGMWGFKRQQQQQQESTFDMSAWVDQIQLPHAFFADMNMLNDKLWPIMQQYGVMVHDSFSCDRTETRPFPTARQSQREHVGSVFLNKASQERQDDVDVLIAAQSKHRCPEDSNQIECPISDIYVPKTITSYTGLRDASNYSVVWHTSNKTIPQIWDKPHTLSQTLQWIDQAPPTTKPPWWPKNLAFEQFPMVHNTDYSEGLWCPAKSFHTEIWTFQCVVVDMGSVHPAAIGGLATKGHIISHDSRIVNPRPLLSEQQVTRLSVLGVIGTYYYPEGYGHFPNEILPR